MEDVTVCFVVPAGRSSRAAVKSHELTVWEQVGGSARGTWVPCDPLITESAVDVITAVEWCQAIFSLYVSGAPDERLASTPDRPGHLLAGPQQLTPASSLPFGKGWWCPFPTFPPALLDFTVSGL